MSEWYDAEDEDIEIDRKAQEVDILVMGNNNGNVYISLTFEQIEMIHKKIEVENG
jgi:hypothetical protein